MRRTQALILFRSIKVRQRLISGIGSVGGALWYFPASALSALVAGHFYFITNPPAVLNGDGFHFNCATILGAALALVLSLSIIPAQKAAEAFSTAILKLYARDPTLLLVFITLSATTIGSLFLGLEFDDAHHEGKLPVALQFLALGVSFDALRFFYSRTLNLLIPQTALELVVRECARQTRRVAWVTEKLAKVQRLSGQPVAQLPALRAVAFASSRLAPTLGSWIGQLDEFAHKAIARRDTLATNAIIAAMVRIGWEYGEARKTSVVLVPDFANLFAGGQSDIGDLLSRIHESIRIVCLDASAQKNELVVQNCLQALARMTLHAMTIVHAHPGPGSYSSAPLSHAPAFYLKMCAEAAIKAGMPDAQLSAIRQCNEIIAAVKPGVNTSTMHATIMDTLFMIAIAGYAEATSVTTYPAMTGIFQAAALDIEQDGYRNQPILETALSNAEFLVPMEIITDMNGQRRMMTFPPYDMGAETSIPAMLVRLANKVEAPEVGRPWVNPFTDFLEASDDICQHYRKIAANNNLQSALLVKWVSDTVIECARIHHWLAHNAPVGCDAFNDSLFEKMRWMISAISFLFKEVRPFADHHAAEAADAVAFWGMVALEEQQFDLAETCAQTIAAVGGHCAAMSQQAYSFADVMENLEKMARAADKLGVAPLGVRYRAMVAQPASVSDAHWPHYLQALATRHHQLEDHLEGYDYRPFRRYDPIAKLRVVLEID